MFGAEWDVTTLDGLLSNANGHSREMLMKEPLEPATLLDTVVVFESAATPRMQNRLGQQLYPRCR